MQTNTQINYTKHSNIRMNQRGINKEMISIALQISKKIYKQGLVYHIIKAENIPYDLPASKKEKLKNIIVVTENNKIITCYKNKNGFKNIKKKNKYRSKRRVFSREELKYIQN